MQEYCVRDSGAGCDFRRDGGCRRGEIGFFRKAVGDEQEERIEHVIGGLGGWREPVSGS